MRLVSEILFKFLLINIVSFAILLVINLFFVSNDVNNY